jgi:hypothetical protein
MTAHISHSCRGTFLIRIFGLVHRSDRVAPGARQ